MKRGTKIYLRSSLYSLVMLILVSLLLYIYGDYKFEQLRNPEHIRKLIDIELPEFKNVETEEDDDYPINHNSYSIWHIIEFATPLSETAVKEIEQVRSKESRPHSTYDGWVLYDDYGYQYKYKDSNLLRRMEFRLSGTKANIYYEVWDSFYFGTYAILLMSFILWITVMSLWGLILFGMNIVRKSKLRANK